MTFFISVFNEKKLIKFYASLGFKIYKMFDNAKDNIELDVNEENVNSNIYLQLSESYKSTYVSINMIATVDDIYNNCYD